MNESTPMRTGVPSTDLPWMQYYPPQLIENLEIPEQTIGEYLRAHCPFAVHYMLLTGFLRSKSQL